jgi:hypothetical protein
MTLFLAGGCLANDGEPLPGDLGAAEFSASPAEISFEPGAASPPLEISFPRWGKKGRVPTDVLDRARARFEGPQARLEPIDLHWGQVPRHGPANLPPLAVGRAIEVGGRLETFALRAAAMEIWDGRRTTQLAVQPGDPCVVEDTRDSGQMAQARAYRDAGDRSDYVGAQAVIEVFDADRSWALVSLRLLDDKGAAIAPNRRVRYRADHCPIGTRFAVPVSTLASWQYENQLRAFLAGLRLQPGQSPGPRKFLEYGAGETRALGVGAELDLVAAKDADGNPLSCDVVAPGQVTFQAFLELPTGIRVSSGTGEAVPELGVAALLRYQPAPGSAALHRCPAGATFFALDTELPDLFPGLLIATSNRALLPDP